MSDSSPQSPEVILKVNIPNGAIDRFWARVPNRPENGCWEWFGILDKDGYGSLKVSGKIMRAHRFSFIIHNGSLNIRMCVCHKCDNPSCVRPDHLFDGTNMENIQDRVQKGRSAFGEKNGIFKNPDIVKGVNNGRAMLTELDVIEIRKRCAAGENQTLMAMEFGVSDTAINHIHSRKNWKHIP